MVEQQMLYSISDDLETLEMMKGTWWGVEPGGQTVICTWLPTDTVEIRLVDSASVWSYELRHGSETVRAKKVYKKQKSGKKK